MSYSAKSAFQYKIHYCLYEKNKIEGTEPKAWNG